MLMQDLFFVVETLHFPLEPLHAADHAVQAIQRLSSILAGECGIRCRFEGGKNIFIFSFDILLNSFEVLACQFMGKSEKRLIL